MAEENKQLPFGTEYAKSARSSCKACKNKIEKGVLRMSMRVPSAHFDGLQDMWYHFDCFWPKTLRRAIGEGDFRGMDNIQWEDQERIRKKIESRTGGAADEPETLKAALKLEYAKSAKAKCKHCGDAIKKAELKVTAASKGFHLSCFATNKTKLGFRGEISQFSGLENLTEEDRKSLETALGVTAAAAKRKANGDVSDAPGSKKPKEDTELKEQLKKQSKSLWEIRNKLQEDVHKKDRLELLERNGQTIPVGEDKILDLLSECMYFGPTAPCEKCDGGQIRFSTSNQTYMCTGNLTEWTKCTFKTMEPNRKKFEIHEDFHENEYLAKFKFVPGKKRVFAARVQLATQSSIPASAKSYGYKSGKSSKSASGSQKYTVKGGSAVDPECEVAEVAHVYKDNKGEAWNAILGKADIINNRNSFYKLQLLQHDNKKKFWVYRAWGRTGTPIGGTKLENFGDDLDGAKSNFKTLYMEKSLNHWSQRHNFVKHPGGMYPVEVDYGEDRLPKSSIAAGSKSELPTPIQDLVRLIFDVEQMKQTMASFEIDMNKMPLGKLSKNQMHKAYAVLTEADQLISQSKVDSNLVLDATNRFYTLIPHDFGLERPKMLDNKKIIQEKIEMLDSLLEIEVAYNLLKSEDLEKSEKDPLDEHYEKLNTKMEVLDKESEEFKVVKKYVKNTHAPTHMQYKLDVKQVFRIDRNGEAERFSKFSHLHNRQLLWHGSRTTNYAGILSQGLRIAPPEAPVTGYMFGKGIYFADMVTKSANYCFTSSSNKTGLLLLSEIALGDMYELTGAKMITKLPEGKHSTKGLGRTEPDPKGDIIKDGVKIPLGKPVNNTVNSTSLLYNEYIVYDVEQVNMKYLIECDFNYGRR